MSLPAPITFTHHQTPRLLLRPLTTADRAAFIHYHQSSRDHLLPWSPRLPDTETLDQRFDAALARSQSSLANGTALRLAAFDASGALAGFFNLNNIVRGVFQCADAGWQVSAHHTNQGLATEGVHALLDIAFAPPPRGLALHRVQANIIPTNTASLRVAEKCGFRHEGLATRMLLINGAWQDHIMLAKLADEHALPASSPAPAGEVVKALRDRRG